MGLFTNFLQNVINFDVALDYSDLVNNYREAVERWKNGYPFLGDCLPEEEKQAFNTHSHNAMERLKHFRFIFSFDNATYKEKEYIVQHKNEIIHLYTIYMKYYPTLKQLQDLRDLYPFGFDIVSQKYANVIVVGNKKQGIFSRPNRQKSFIFRGKDEVIAIPFMTLEERAIIIAHKEEIKQEDKIQRQKKEAAEKKEKEAEEAKLIAKAGTIRSWYPNGYKWFVCGSLETPITLEYAKIAIEKEELIKLKEREFSMNKNVSQEEFSPLKFGKISFKKWKKIATSDIKTYKVIMAKLPNRYNHHQEGEKRSFLLPDRFQSYSIGSIAESDLNICKHTVEYDYEIKQDYHNYEIIGIPSFVERQECNYVQWYKVYSCECIIPKGSEYYVNGDGECVSNSICLTKIEEL